MQYENLSRKSINDNIKILTELLNVKRREIMRQEKKFNYLGIDVRT